MSRFTILATIAVLLASGQTGSASPTAVVDVDNPDRAVYQEFAGVASCQSYNWCQVGFPAVPAGKRLVVDHISCIATASKVEPKANYVVSLSGNLAPNWFFADVRGTRIVVDKSTHWIVEAGATPSLAINETVSRLVSMSCTMTGHYATP